VILEFLFFDRGGIEMEIDTISSSSSTSSLEDQEEEASASAYTDPEGNVRRELIPLEKRTDLTWWEATQLSNSYDSEEEGSRPIRQVWPSDTTLFKEHFTIDEQCCLVCRKKLGYALPMNKQANPRFLFCTDENGNARCAEKAEYISCWACGNLNNMNSAHIVTRPGNSAYYGPSQIYDFMCKHCHKDMMEMEPGKEECAAQLAKIREIRRNDKLGIPSSPFPFPTPSPPTPQYSYVSDQLEPSEKKRKRGAREKLEKEEEECYVNDPDRMQ
jgi:hypothetical protein